MVKADDRSVDVSISEIREASYQIRSQGVDRNSDEYIGLKNSIAADGILEPVVLAPSGSKYELLLGARRVAIAKELEMKTVPAVIRNSANDLDIRAWRLVENVHRVGLTDEEKGQGIKAIYEKSGYKMAQVIQFLTVINSRRYAERDAQSPNPKKYKYIVNQSRGGYREGSGRKQTTDIPEEFISLMDRVGYSAATQTFLLKYIGIVPEPIRRQAEEEGLSIQKKTLLTHPDILKEPEAARHLIDKMRGMTYSEAKSERDQEIYNVRKGDVYVKDEVSGETLRHDFKVEPIKKGDRASVKDHRAILADIEMHMFPLCDVLCGENESNCDVDIIKGTKKFRVDLFKKVNRHDLVLYHNYLSGLKVVVDNSLKIIEEEMDSRNMKDQLLKE